jgi:hypothetical protein
MRKVIRFYRKFCKVKATKFHKEEYELKQNLECTQSSLQDMVQDKGLQQLVNTLKQRIKELEDVKVAKQQIRVRLTWKQKDCTITKEFFTSIKPNPNKVGISTSRMM